MITGSDLPALNATLNGIAAVFLGVGYFAIRTWRVRLHATCMISAFITSTLFLTSYITYHFVLKAGATRFSGQGWIRPLYYGMLISHIILAGVVVPLALVTLWRAARARFDRHRRIARITWPIWMYVSVTGVLIYIMLYHLYPSR
ncbi:MAG TPA: DUF420 domain-containing protein [Phycisphaerae bacterium]